MSSAIKNQKNILKKLRISELNSMQKEAQFAIHSNPEVVLLSPTGTGKTLAFLLPLISELDTFSEEVQVLILAPSRELAIQLEQVTREMGSGYKVTACYGGQSFSKDKLALKTPPAILIGTPGRIADHLRRATFSTDSLKALVLDEFDKSLEIGFEEDMTEIIEALPNVKKKVLTSATQAVEIPDFVGLSKPKIIDYLAGGVARLKTKLVISPSKDKLQTLVDTICHLGNQPGIIFCNFKDSIKRVSDFLTQNNIGHGCFYGGLEQKDRERALFKFRNGTHQIIIATDLAARGLDVPEIKFIIHYHLPHRREEFTHRNGRTARMHNEGTAYILKWTEEILPDFIKTKEIETLKIAPPPAPSNWNTLFLSGGRRDKISKGDIAGLFFRKGELEKDELGIIELKQDCAFVAVAASKVDHLIQLFNNTRLKKKKIRVTLI
ncbi:MAG: DEAD/DEAH box helicase [Saprospiraceae bacterium]|jgi:superfamily II DNA/RNA helicase|nr:DEAD/DEAH box helicase [Saprospiraceae bacterium]